MGIQPWPDLAAAYREKIASGIGDEPFRLALGAVAQIAADVEGFSLYGALFGWTSMHDFCIQQSAHEPYTRPYLRLTPRVSSEVELRFADTPVQPSQWHRIVPAKQVSREFRKFLNSVRWVERRSQDRPCTWISALGAI